MAVRAFLIWLCWALPAAAHDFWLQPESYAVARDAALPFTLQVGHGPFRQVSPIAQRRIVRFTATASDGTVTDLRDALQAGVVRLDGVGTYVLALETDDALSFLPALRFNEYLQAEGLTPALEQRARTGRMQANGSERYSRRAKAIVRRGERAPSRVTEPLGLTLEIVPELDPTAVPRPAALPVRVLYEGRPLSGALVKLTDLAHDADPFETRRTDETGRASFTMPIAGSWLLNVIWTKPLPPSRDTEFETIFSSLSFAISPS